MITAGAPHSCCDILRAGVEAAELVAQLGHNPAKQSLSQLFDGTAAVARGSRQVQVVSMQTQWLNAKRVSQLLLQISEPAVVIASGQASDACPRSAWSPGLRFDRS